MDETTANLLAALEKLSQGQLHLLHTIAHEQALSYLQVRILLRLQNVDRDISFLALREYLDLSNPTVSVALSALVKRKYIVRRTDRTDRRVKLFSLSASGRNIALRLAQWAAPISHLLDGMPPEQRVALLRILAELVEKFHSHNIISKAGVCLSCRNYTPVSPDRFHCAFLGKDLDSAQLRIECPDHVHRAG